MCLPLLLSNIVCANAAEHCHVVLLYRYASTCQTLGMNIGYFTSFTAFLALNDANFCNNYLREVSQPEGILPLAGYLQFWGWFFVVITVLIALFKHETNFQPAGKHA